jgi:hypothetical protein
MDWKTIAEKTPNKNHLRIFTLVAHCFPNILDAIVLENINLFKE